MLVAKTLNFYKRPEIQEAIVEQGRGKEIAVKMGDRGFGSRPQALTYPNDVLEFAKKGTTSFHCSEELWTNPLLLKSDMTKKEQDEIRDGWDFILDIDCKFFDYSKIATHYTVKALEYCGVKSITVKFSGNKGFHIAVPWEAFPKELKDEQVKLLFPEAPKRMAEYIKFLIREPVKEEIKKREGKDIGKISKNVGIPVDKLKTTTSLGSIELNPDPFIEIDTLLISARHLYRMPYSFHEKSELVSVPIDKDKILEFDKEQAKPENVTTNIKFLERDVEPNNAAGLLVRAYDYKPVFQGEEKERESKEWELPEEAIGEECFPPCIKKILAGIEDGRKRAVFVLRNFLQTCGWSPEMIEEAIYAWNKKNKEPLREVLIKGQLKYTKGKPIPPPNCHNDAYYMDMGVKCPEHICSRFKNPANYARQCSKKPKIKKGKTKKAKEEKK